MSDPSTPTTAPGLASVTPDASVGEKATRLVRFAPKILDLIVDVLAPDSEIRPTLKAGIGHLFTEHWQVHTWEDLMVFSSADVATALATANGGFRRSLTLRSLLRNWGISLITPSSEL
ncbi:hypothetical protein MHU86_25565 [Fragilaria crotonensis]|nr:hypothetical protein MHU86_25565 [Fragilaria crotonensis]